MQKIEITRGTFNIHCPFCGMQVIEPQKLLHCEHTLFHATEKGGFEYINPRLDIGEDPDIGDFSMEEYLEQIDLPNAILICQYQPVPSGFAGFVGFAP